MAVVLFLIECLDFWRVAGNKIGCDCCEKVRRCCTGVFCTAMATSLTRTRNA
jgi:hypothetical protein